ncbi:MAG: hypothetical protein MMC23_004158 [Stictis urceolatum]|nr:hypothetical protein [Stictis urceolata]
MAFQSQYGYTNVYQPPAYNNSPPTVTQEYKPQFSTYANSAPDDSSFQNAPLNEIKHRKKSSFRSRLCLILSFSIGVLWIGPAVFLIYINVINKVIGASAWCPGGHCSVISYYYMQNQTTAGRAVQADENDHDLLGALQFAAKGMEVWFVGVAGSLVYTVSRMISKRRGGMPVGYLLTHLEFGDLRAIFDKGLYTSASNKRAANRAGNAKHTKLLFLFVALVFTMCVLSNLMGPSVAVMMIPTLNWIDTKPIVVGRFQKMLSDTKPANGWHDTIPGCNATQLEDEDWTCTAATYIDNLDSLVEAAVAYVSQNATNRVSDGTIYAPTLENTFPFSFNFTQSPDNTTRSKVWAPNRQVIRAIAQDFDELAGVVLGDNVTGPYADFNSSLGLQLQREGPILGMDFDADVMNRTVINVGEDKYVHCMWSYAYVDYTYYTRCHSRGVGWNTTNSEANFTISASDYDADLYFDRLFIKTYWSDKMGYLNNNDSALINACYQNEALFDGKMNLTARATCDWDSIFSDPIQQPILDAGFSGSPRDGLITEWTLTEISNVTAFVTQYFPVQAVSTYSVDVTDVFPTIQEVRVPNIPKESEFTPIILNANWPLLAWSLTQGSDVPGVRPSGLEPKMAMASIIPAGANDSHIWTGDENENLEKMFYVSLSTGLQTLSMVTFDVEETSDTDTADIRHPILHHNLKRQVWKFGLSSRTAHLGIVVMCLGVIAVLLRSVLLLIAGSRNPTTTDLVVNALEHRPQGEFGAMSSDREAGKVRYRVLREGEGRITFEHTS